MNPLLLRCFYSSRSGSHAIINWLAEVLGGDVALFNRRKLHVNPLVGDILPSDPLLATRNPARRELYTNRHTAKEEDLAAKSIIITYESKDISLTPPRESINTTHRGFDIVIVRDIYNWLASSLVLCARKPLSPYGYSSCIDSKIYHKLENAIAIWQIHAEEALGTTSHLQQPTLPILFNCWFVDQSYRESICETLGVPYQDTTLDYVTSVYGRASRFDAQRYEGHASDMQVLNRWEFFMSNPLYWDVLERYPETEELSNRLFGEIIPEREKYPLGELARRFRDEP